MKVPYNPHTGRRASTSDPTTWCTYEQTVAEVQRRGYDGHGFVLTPKDSLVAFDLDNCRDPATGVIEPWAEEIVAKFASYTEISPSGTGMRIFIKATKPGPRCRTGLLEIYDQDRYVTVTGQHLPGTPRTIEPRQDQLNELYAALFAAHSEPILPHQASLALTADDEDILAQVRSGRNGAKFEHLWNGDSSDYDNDESRAELALASMLAPWCGYDPERIERLISQSALGQRDKWQNRADYRNRTIAKALQGLVADEPQVVPVPISAPDPSNPDEHGTDFIATLDEARAETKRLRSELDRYRGQVKTLQAMLTTSEQEKKHQNDHFSRIFAVLNNQALGKSTASVALRLAFECASALSRGEEDEDGWVTIYDPAIAEKAGVSTSTVSNKKKELQQRGLFEFDTYTTPGDPATGKPPRLRSRVRMLNDLDTTLDILADPTISKKAHGGKRARGIRCSTCGNARTQVRHETTVSCVSCGEILKKFVHTSTEDSQRDGTHPIFQDAMTTPVDVSLRRQDEMRATNEKR